MYNSFYDPYFELNRQNEKKQLKKSSNCVGIVMLMMSFLAIAVSTAVYLLVKFFTGDNERTAYLLSEDLVISNIYNAVVTAFIFVVPFIFLMKLLGSDNDVKPVFTKPKLDFTTCAMYSLFVVVVTLAASLVTSMVSTVFSVFTGSEPYVPSLGEEYSNPHFAFFIDIVCTCIFPAFFEEFAFRGVLLNSLKKYGDIPAIVVSSLMFGLMHGNFVQLPYTFIMGLALGFVTLKTNSIYCAVGAHFLNNFIATIQTWYPTVGAVFAYVILVLCIVSMLVLSKRKLLTRDQKFIPSYFKESTRVKHIIFAPVMIVYIVLQLIASFQFMQ